MHSTNAIIQNTGIVLEKMISFLGRPMEIAQIIFIEIIQNTNKEEMEIIIKEIHPPNKKII